MSLEKVRPLLSLTIPTYNRSRYLAQLLESLLLQVANESRCEVLISDNASSDETGNMLRSFAERGLAFRYIRNVENCGADANFRQCFEEARGKYVWVMGDDDLLAPSVIEKILDLLEKEDYDLIYLSSMGFSGDDRPPIPVADPLGRFAELITDGAYFLSRVGAQIGLISSNIVNKDHLMSTLHPPLTSLRDTNLLQVGWLFPVIHKRCRVLYVWERVVLYRKFNSGGWGICRIFGVNLNGIALRYFAQEPILAAALMNSVLSMWMPHQVLQMRLGYEKAMEDEDIVRSLSPVFKYNWRFWAFVYPVAKAPVLLATLIYRTNRLLVRSHRMAKVLLNHCVHRENLRQP